MKQRVLNQRFNTGKSVDMLNIYFLLYTLTFLIPGLISDIDSGNRTKSKGRNP
jgi:hypothetical protein